MSTASFAATLTAVAVALAGGTYAVTQEAVPRLAEWAYIQNVTGDVQNVAAAVVLDESYSGSSLFDQGRAAAAVATTPVSKDTTVTVTVDRDRQGFVVSASNPNITHYRVTYSFGGDNPGAHVDPSPSDTPAS